MAPEQLPGLAAAAEINSLRRFVSRVQRTYVGQELGEPILVGQIRRGEVHTAKTALMLVDLRDFTALSDEPTPAIGHFDLRGLPANRNFFPLIPGWEFADLLPGAGLAIGSAR